MGWEKPIIITKFSKKKNCRKIRAFASKETTSCGVPYAMCLSPPPTAEYISRE